MNGSKNSTLKMNIPIFNNKIADDEKMLTKKEVANFLNVTIKMIDRQISLQAIPHYKVGRLVRFSKSEVLSWFQKSN